MVRKCNECESLFIDIKPSYPRIRAPSDKPKVYKVSIHVMKEIQKRESCSDSIKKKKKIKRGSTNISLRSFWVTTSFKELHLKAIFPLFYCMFYMILSGFPLIFCLFCSVSDGKSCFSVRKSILTNKRHAEHPFAGQNTQQIYSPFKDITFMYSLEPFFPVCYCSIEEAYYLIGIFFKP